MKRSGVAKLLFLFVAANLALICWGLLRRAPSGELRVTFLDVGQGDALVLESPSGKTLVVDTGGLLPNGEDQGRRVVARYLRHRGINRIDMLALTHPDADHVGGAASLLQQFPVGLLLGSGLPSASPVVTRLLETAKARGAPFQKARRGQELDFGDGVIAHVLAPSDTAPATDNGLSIVLRVEYGRTAFLLTGDIEAEGESELLQSGQPLSCDVLKVAHHGSRTSTTPAFLKAAHPRCAVISVGANNFYGHPSREVLQRLRTSGARLYRTDRNGAVTCRSDGITVRTEAMTP